MTSYRLLLPTHTTPHHTVVLPLNQIVVYLVHQAIRTLIV
jgi:hypothetical protein